jgi:stage II sporulation protein R
MKLKNWELSFILAFAAALLLGSSLSREQAALSDKLVRLHVVANSDSAADQSLKLRVRDAILSAMSSPLSAASDAAGARTVINDSLGTVRDAALAELRRAESDCDVAVSLEEEDFPTREYDTFSLPAGRYTALRVVIGDGAGKNWWCVVFPPLCTEVATARGGAFASMTDGEMKLIGEEDGYVVRFKCMELLAKIKNMFGK